MSFQGVSERLSEIPEGPMRDQVVRLVNRLLDFTVSCRCDEAQGDGVPCGSVLTQCSGCPRCLGLLAELEARLPR
jgi:hypothetical protein